MTDTLIKRKNLHRSVSSCTTIEVTETQKHAILKNMKYSYKLGEADKVMEKMYKMQQCTTKDGGFVIEY